jgi:hypothetical protein
VITPAKRKSRPLTELRKFQTPFGISLVVTILHCICTFSPSKHLYWLIGNENGILFLTVIVSKLHLNPGHHNTSAAMTAAVGIYLRLGLPEPWNAAIKPLLLIVYGAASAVV